MKNEREKLEKILAHLQGLPSDFVVIYQPKLRVLPFKLKWRAASCPRLKARAEVDKLATKYVKLAAHCYLNGRTLVTPERRAGPKSAIRLWHGLAYAVGKDTTPGPVNAIGQRWWLVVIANGPLRNAGYALIARVAAKTRSEVDQHVAAVGVMMSRKVDKHSDDDHPHHHQ